MARGRRVASKALRGAYEEKKTCGKKLVEQSCKVVVQRDAEIS